MRTNRVNWNLQNIVEQYLQITEVEPVFRSPKSELGLRPIWHQDDNQIRAHLFIAVLAYHAVHQIRTHLNLAAELGPHNNHHPGGWRRPDRLSAGRPAQRRGRGNRSAGRHQARQPPAHQPAKRLT